MPYLDAEAVEKLRPYIRTLVVVANRNPIQYGRELDAVLQYLTPLPGFAGPAYWTSPRKCTYHIGVLGKYPAAVLQLGQGPLKASAEIADVLEDWKHPPHQMLLAMPGMAFGLQSREHDAGQQEIGDILLADCVRYYDHRRLSEGKQTYRADPQHVNPSLLRHLWPAVRAWEEAAHTRALQGKVHVGLVVCGGTLCDERIFRETLRHELRQDGSEPIGGEMESVGATVAVERFNDAAHTAKASFIFLKAISDWGFEKKSNPEFEEFQPAVCATSAGFLAHLLSTPNSLVHLGIPDVAKLASDPGWRRASGYSSIGTVVALPSAATDSEFEIREALATSEVERRLREELKGVQSGLVGRDKLRDWLGAQERAKERGYIVLTGTPGWGKTTFLRSWLTEGRSVSTHRVAWFSRSEDTTVDVLSNVLSQLPVDPEQFQPKPQGMGATAIEIEAAWAAAFSAALEAAAAELPVGRKLVVYIDSIHECQPLVRPMVELLPRVLAPGVIIVLTQRPPERPLDEFLSHVTEPRQAELGLWQQEDIDQYISTRLLDRGISLRAAGDFAEELIKRAEGCFAMVEHVLASSELKEDIRSPNGIPRGFDAYLERQWNTTMQTARARGLPVDGLEAAMATTSVVSVTNRQEILGFVSDVTAESAASATSGVLDRLWKLIRVFLEPVPSRRGASQNYRFFHPRVEEFFREILPEALREAAAEHLLDQRHQALLEKMGNEESQQALAYLVEDSEFQLRLRDWLALACRGQSLHRYTSPVGWYLYGHYWFDEFTREFNYCEELLKLLGSLEADYVRGSGTNQHNFQRMVEALGGIRENWCRHSLWRLRRRSEASLRSIDVQNWRAAAVSLDHLLSLFAELGLKPKDGPVRRGDDAHPANDPAMENVCLAFLLALKAECALGQGRIDDADRLYRSAMPFMEVEELLYWCLPYLHLDRADCELDRNDPIVAADLVERALTIVEDEWMGTDRADNGGHGECYRVAGDVLWNVGDRITAFAAYRASSFLGVLSHADMGSKADAYTIALHEELAWSLADRVVEVFNDGEHQIALDICGQCEEFWKSSTRDVDGSVRFLAEEQLALHASLGDPASLLMCVTPRPPASGQKLALRRGAAAKLAAQMEPVRKLVRQRIQEIAATAAG